MSLNISCLALGPWASLLELVATVRIAPATAAEQAGMRVEDLQIP